MPPASDASDVRVSQTLVVLTQHCVLACSRGATCSRCALTRCLRVSRRGARSQGRSIHHVLLRWMRERVLILSAPEVSCRFHCGFTHCFSETFKEIWYSPHKRVTGSHELKSSRRFSRESPLLAPSLKAASHAMKNDPAVGIEFFTMISAVGIRPMCDPSANTSHG